MTEGTLRVILESRQRRPSGLAAYFEPTSGKIACALCDDAWPEHLEHNLEIDRKIPGSEGGKYTEDNCQLVCPACNRIKGEKPNAVGRRLCLDAKRGREAARAEAEMRMYPMPPGPRYIA